MKKILIEYGILTLIVIGTLILMYIVEWALGIDRGNLKFPAGMFVGLMFSDIKRML